jgi:hypothetical protein
LDRTGGLKKGEFLAHRNVHRSEDETANSIIEGTCDYAHYNDDLRKAVSVRVCAVVLLLVLAAGWELVDKRRVSIAPARMVDKDGCVA